MSFGPQKSKVKSVLDNVASAPCQTFDVPPKKWISQSMT